MFLLEDSVLWNSTYKNRDLWNKTENCPYEKRLKNMTVNTAFIPTHPVIPILVKFKHHEMFLHNEFLPENAKHMKTHVCSALTLLATIFMQQEVLTKIAKNRKRKFMPNKTCSRNYLQKLLILT